MAIATSMLAMAMVWLQASPPGETPPALLSGSISTTDYPPSSVRAREEGDVTIRFTVTADGRVTDCMPEQSSGSAALDARSCAIWVRRTRYTPAKDAAGRAVARSWTQPFHWRLNRPCPPFVMGHICINGGR